MTPDQAIRNIIDGTLALEGDKNSRIDVTLIREPEDPQKLERHYRRNGWMFAMWRRYQMDDGVGQLHLYRLRGIQTDAMVAYDCLCHDSWFNTGKWQKREILISCPVANKNELRCQLSEMFDIASQSDHATPGRKGWSVVEVSQTKERGTVLIIIRKQIT